MMMGIHLLSVVDGDTEDEINGNFTVTLKPDVDSNHTKDLYSFTS